ncbi:hypothetical protein A3D72_03370 [Candidatus Uhrbacteria bacterium RIFCSPHIGHO2_02_FULL_57_19]|uniref:Uncharacterized protein n=2 Tax=Parcubacteria group TaxID=1794811 RepID=A0A1F6CSI2_9BACT|nr:MAG: hypothetical protein A2704_02065 [Candidatus Kaiserbacteria bacterium RIFCSPHIGHO2_01_FULL_54_36b]OGL72507.1 MAG: hypothetical protein A3D72_03370 [Candidatus Uhrbacteria bacterium RIFCSPHIGHO2_02_FULL_57_19]
MKFPGKNGLNILPLIAIFVVIVIALLKPKAPISNTNVGFEVNAPIKDQTTNTNGIRSPRSREFISGIEVSADILKYKDPEFQISFEYPRSFGDIERQFYDYTTGLTKIVETPGGPVEETGKALVLFGTNPQMGFIFELVSSDYPFGSEGFPVPYKGDFNLTKICSGEESVTGFRKCLTIDGEQVLITREFDYAGGSWTRAYRNARVFGFHGLSVMVSSSGQDETDVNLLNNIIKTLVLE